MEEQHDLAKWLEGKMTGSELEAFERAPEFAEYQKIKTYSAQLQTPDFDTNNMYQTIVSQPKSQPVIQLKPNWFLRIAAVLILALGLFFASGALLPQTEMAENGKQHIFQLPDASQVTLNSGSEIEYKKWNWNKNRSLELQGEAFFKVTKGKTFDVYTNLGKVTVVGTQFNVKSRDKRFEVSCFEGKVRVANNGRVVFLTKGQSVAFENGKALDIAASTDTKPSWMNSQMIFYAENLEAVIAEMERQYAIEITSKNIRSSQKFTGTIPAENLEMALQIISSAYNFKYTKTGKNSITFTGK